MGRNRPFLGSRAGLGLDEGRCRRCTESQVSKTAACTIGTNLTAPTPPSSTNQTHLPALGSLHVSSAPSSSSSTSSTPTTDPLSISIMSGGDPSYLSNIVLILGSSPALTTSSSSPITRDTSSCHQPRIEPRLGRVNNPMRRLPSLSSSA